MLNILSLLATPVHLTQRASGVYLTRYLPSLYSSIQPFDNEHYYLINYQNIYKRTDNIKTDTNEEEGVICTSSHDSDIPQCLFSQGHWSRYYSNTYTFYSQREEHSCDIFDVLSIKNHAMSK